MSASQDKSQKVTFVYRNLYELFKAETASQEAGAVQPPPFGLTRLKPSERVIKAGEEAVTEPASPRRVSSRRVASYQAPSLLGKRLERETQSASPQATARVAKTPAKPQKPTVTGPGSEAIQGLKRNLDTLQGLQSRLRCMLREIEGLVDSDE